MKRYISIDMKAMRAFGLSLEKWVLLENVHFLSNNEYHSCHASKKKLADHLCVSERQVFKLLSELEEDGFIVKNTFGHLIVTGKWIDISSITDNRISEEQKEEVEEPKAPKEPKEPKAKKFSFALSKAYSFEALSSEYKTKLLAYAITKDKAVNYQKFENYHGSKGSKFKDWSRAYSTWLSNAEEFQKISIIKPEVVEIKNAKTGSTDRAIILKEEGKAVLVDTLEIVDITVKTIQPQPIEEGAKKPINNGGSYNVNGLLGSLAGGFRV